MNTPDCTAVHRARHCIANTVRRTLLRIYYTTGAIYRNPILTLCCCSRSQAGPKTLQIAVLGCAGAGKSTLCFKLCTPVTKSRPFETFTEEMIKEQFSGRAITYSQHKRGLFSQNILIKYVEIGEAEGLTEAEVNDLYAKSHGIILLVDLSSCPCQSPSTLMLNTTLRHKFLLHKPSLIVGSKVDLCKKSMDMTEFSKVFDLKTFASKYKTRMFAMVSGMETKQSEIHTNVSWFVNQILQDETEITERISVDMEELNQKELPVKTQNAKARQCHGDFLLQKLVREFRANQSNSSEDELIPAEPPCRNVEYLDVTADVAQYEENDGQSIKSILANNFVKETEEDNVTNENMTMEDCVEVNDLICESTETEVQFEDAFSNQVHPESIDDLNEKFEQIFIALNKAKEAGNTGFRSWVSFQEENEPPDSDEKVEQSEHESSSESESDVSYDTEIEVDSIRNVATEQVGAQSWIEEIDDPDGLEKIFRKCTEYVGSPLPQKIQILVRTENGCSSIFTVNTECKVSNLKHKIFQRYGTPTNLITLYVESAKLKNEAKVAEFGIPLMKRIDVCLRLRGGNPPKSSSPREDPNDSDHGKKRKNEGLSSSSKLKSLLAGETSVTLRGDLGKTNSYFVEVNDSHVKAGGLKIHVEVSEPTVSTEDMLAISRKSFRPPECEDKEIKDITIAFCCLRLQFRGDIDDQMKSPTIEFATSTVWLDLKTQVEEDKQDVLTDPEILSGMMASIGCPFTKPRFHKSSHELALRIATDMHPAISFVDEDPVFGRLAILRGHTPVPFTMNVAMDIFTLCGVNKDIGIIGYSQASLLQAVFNGEHCLKDLREALHEDDELIAKEFCFALRVLVPSAARSKVKGSVKKLGLSYINKRGSHTFLIYAQSGEKYTKQSKGIKALLDFVEDTKSTFIGTKEQTFSEFAEDSD